ncbi:MAG: hypothetical protein JWQ57_5194, partial [Mucilaginibacter sp.]|nr:hypothetical protein [Mucilaginibacter sp.]
MNYTVRIKARIFTALMCLFICSCKPSPKQPIQTDNSHTAAPKLKSINYTDTSFKVIHVFVALC